jgi:hypothetical protein
VDFYAVPLVRPLVAALALVCTRMISRVEKSAGNHTSIAADMSFV